MSQYKQSAKVLAVGCVSAAVVPCFVQPLNPTSLAPASRVSQAHVSLSRVEKNDGMYGGVSSGVAPGFAAVAAVLGCTRVACGRNRQPTIACNAYGGNQSPYGNELGAGPPSGFFDPLGFVNGAPREKFRNYREAEIKHGRLAMMAAVGLLAQSVTRLSGFEGTPGGIEAVFEEGLPRQGLASILVFIGVLESFVFNQNPNLEPGNFGDPFRAGEYTMEKRTLELSNGRLGMLAFLSITFFNLTLGKSAAEQLGLNGL